MRAGKGAHPPRVAQAQGAPLKPPLPCLLRAPAQTPPFEGQRFIGRLYGGQKGRRGHGGHRGHGGRIPRPSGDFRATQIPQLPGAPNGAARSLWRHASLGRTRGTARPRGGAAALPRGLTGSRRVGRRRSGRNEPGAGGGFGGPRGVPEPLPECSSRAAPTRPWWCRVSAAAPPVMVAGGRVLVVPCLQQIQRISLNTLTLNVRSEKVYTRHGVPISVTGIAQVKIQGQNKEMLAAACQMFLGKSEAEIAQIALETLEGHQRAIMAHMTVEVARTQQAIAAQRAQVALVERAQRAQLQEHEVGRRERELEATVRKPAEAERYRLERLAEAQRVPIVPTVPIVPIVSGGADYAMVTGSARADALARRSQADAAQAAAKAEAFARYPEAAVVDMVLQRLPQVAEAVAQPLLGTRRVTLVGAATGPVGVARIPTEILDVVSRLPGAIEAVAGVTVTPVRPPGRLGPCWGTPGS
ncbi:flotillin-1-like protein, partial [Columba guinea]